MMTQSLAGHFDSEHLLQQAIAALLARIPEVNGVQILQGAQELGKDIVFHSVGPLGEPVYCACVVKNTAINGKVGKTGSVRALFDQIEQALDTPFIDALGESRQIHHVYVVSPEELGQSSLNAIKGKIAHRSGQVVFKCGAELYAMFMRHWPEFLADEARMLENYAVRLEEAAGNLNAMYMLALNHSLGEATRQVYVEPSFERVLRTYELRWPDDEVYANVFAETLEWSKARVIEVEGVFRSVIEFFRHCEQWPLPGWEPEHTALLDQLADSVTGCIERLKESVLAAYLRQVTWRPLPKHDPAKQPRKRTFDQLRTDDTFRFDQDQMKSMRTGMSSVKRDIHRLNKVLRPVLEKLTDVVLGYPAPETPLNDQRFRVCCSIDDCLLAFSGPYLSVVDRRVFKLGTRLHHKYRGSLVIEGGPGFGKTSFCHWNALADAAALADRSADAIPIYVPLHELTRSSGGSFEELYLSRIGRSVLIPERLTMQSGLIRRLYLDGIDEIPSYARRVELMNAAFSAHLDCQVIVTVRDYLREPALAGPPRVALSGLDDSELRRLVSLWVDNDEAAVATFIGQLNAAPSLKSIARVPLLATVMVLVFMRTGRLPENRSRLYSMFVHLLSGGWDLAKGTIRASQFSVDYKLMVLNGVASEVHGARRREFDEELFFRGVRRVITRTDRDTMNRLLAEMLADGVVIRTGKSIEFAHLSYQEFFAARELLGHQDPVKLRRILMRFLTGDDWWREVLFFYIGLSDNPRTVSQWLLDSSKTGAAVTGGDVAMSLSQSNIAARLRVLIKAVQSEYPDFDVRAVTKHSIASL